MAITGINYQSRHNLNSGNNTPHGIVEVGDAVWIANNSDDRVYTYDASVAYQSAFALPSGNGHPRGLAYLKTHQKVASVDTGTNRVYLMSETGTDLSENYSLDSGNSTPEGILFFESIDELWVPDWNQNKWYRYRYTGSALTYLGTYDMHASNTDARGGCYIPQDESAGCLNASTKQLFVYGSDGSHLRTLDLNTGQSTPRATAVVGFQLWVADNNSDDVWRYDLQSDITLTISTGYPTRYVEAIGKTDPVDKNDYPIRIDSDVDVLDLTESDVTVTGATIQSFKAYSARQFEVVIRPPATGSGRITVAIDANAVSAGNAAVSQNFSYTDSAGDLLFNWNTAIPGLAQGIVNKQHYGPEIGFVVQAKRIRILGVTSSPYQYKIWTLKHDGTRLSSEDVIIGSPVNIPLTYIALGLNLVNGLWFAHVHSQLQTNQREDIYRSYFSNRDDIGTWQTFYPSNFGISHSDFGGSGVGTHPSALSADINRWGLFFASRANRRVFAENFLGRQQNIIGVTGGPLMALGDRLYVGETVYLANSKSTGLLLPSEKLELSPAPDGDAAVYGNWSYYTSGTSLYRVDLQQYRVPAVRSRILPQFVKEGESLPLKHLVSGAETFLFETGYDVPDYLSIDTHLNLVVADGQIREDRCVLVKLRAFNRRYEVPFAFYIVVLKKKLPEWKAIDVLPVDNGETVNLFDLVPNATQLAWKNGFNVPSGYTLTDGQLTVTNQTSEAPVAVELTATNDAGSRDKTFSVQARVPSAIVSSDVYAYRMLIGDIDVTSDLLEVSNIHQSLDVISPNEFVSDDASFTLRSPGGRYDGRVAGNFWDANRLNKNGYLSEIELWVDIFDTGSVQSKLLFHGLILEVQSSINGVSAVINCVDRTYTLKNTPVGSVGIEKFSTVRQIQETYQGEYAPEASILPILRETASVVSGDMPVPISNYMNAPEADAGDPTCYVTENRILTRGGYLPDDPLLKFKTAYQHRHLKFLIKTMSEASGFFNAKADIREASLAARKHITSRGNVAFNIEQTKTVRTVVDWVHDATNDVFYQLLSHPSAYIQDGLVAYTPADDRYETVRVFDRGLRLTQFTTSDFDTFYILATTAYDFDWIETPDPPNANEAVFDPLDSSRETEDTRILKYVKSTDTLTTFVDVDDDYPAQIGLHYMAGFENARHLRLREGIFSESRSTFRIHNNKLYYRYATWSAFGVARATAGGTTSAILTVTRDNYFNALNFDFDITADGDVYMVYAEGQQNQSTLKVQKYDASAGTTAVVFQDPQEMWLGCHEVELHNDRLYCVLPIQRVSGATPRRDIKKSAGAVFVVIHPFSRYIKTLKRYDYVQLSCRSLTVHENHLYFAEYPDASTHYAPCNPDLDGWDSDDRCNVVPPNKVWLKRVVSDTEIEDVISPWYDGQPFNATAVRMLSDGDKLHAIVRYSDKFEISAVDADAASAHNEQWLTFSADVPYYVAAIPSGSLHDAMVAFAQLGNARLQIVADRFRFVDADPYEALLSTGLSDAASQLNYKDANKEFPTSGHVLIGKEIIRYTQRTAARLSGLTRGVGGTQAAAHIAGERVLFLDKVIHQSSIDNPYQDINISIDTNKFYNTVRDTTDTTVAVDSESVARFGTRAYRLSLTLSDHQIPWRQFINAKTLNRLSPIKSIVRIKMKAAYYLDIGDVVTFAYGGEILMPIRIIDIEHTQTGGQNPRRETHIIGQEIQPLPRVSFGSATVADKTWTQYSPITAFVLPEAEDPKDSYVYRLEGLSMGARFDSKTREVSGFPIHVQSAQPLRYIVTDSDNPTWSDELRFNITVNRAALAFVGSVPDLIFEVNQDIGVIKFPPARGGTGLITYALPNLPAGVNFDTILLQLTGEPTRAAAESIKSYTATDEAPTTITDDFTMQVVNALAISVNSTLRVTSGVAFNILMRAATGGLPPYTYSMSGLSGNLAFNASTRRFTGTITGNLSGLTYTVTDARGKQATDTFALSTVPLLRLQGISRSTSGSSFFGTAPAATGGQAPYTYSVTEINNGYNWSWTFNPATRYYTVHSPNATIGESLTLRYRVTDSSGQVATATLSFRIDT